jgi:hypothetical protein
MAKKPDKAKDSSIEATARPPAPSAETAIPAASNTIVPPVPGPDPAAPAAPVAPDAVATIAQGGARKRVAASPLLFEVACPSGSRRRAGLDFGPAPVVLDEETLSEAQIAAIAADPLLVLRRVDHAGE